MEVGADCFALVCVRLGLFALSLDVIGRIYFLLFFTSSIQLCFVHEG